MKTLLLCLSAGLMMSGLAHAETINCSVNYRLADGPGTYGVSLDTATMQGTLTSEGQSYKLPVVFEKDLVFPSAEVREVYFSFATFYVKNLSDADLAPFVSDNTRLSVYRFVTDKDGSSLINLVIATDKKTNKEISKLLYIAAAPSGICK